MYNQSIPINDDKEFHHSEPFPNVEYSANIVTEPLTVDGLLEKNTEYEQSLTNSDNYITKEKQIKMVIINTEKVKRIVYFVSLLCHLTLAPCLIATALTIDQDKCAVYSVELMLAGIFEMVPIAMYYRRCKLSMRLLWYIFAASFVMFNTATNSSRHWPDTCPTVHSQIFLWCFWIMNYWRIFLILAYIFIFECPPQTVGPPPQIIDLNV